MPEALVVLTNALPVRAEGTEVFREPINWVIRPGDAWALHGPLGSGKTTLAEVLVGKHVLRSGERRWPSLAPGEYPSQIIHFVPFKEDSRLFSYERHYYQQRFHLIDPNDDLSVHDYLTIGNPSSAVDLIPIVARLGLSEKLSLSFLKLSNGQVRRARIAKALLRRPRLLILDEPFLGLDETARAELSAMLAELPRMGTALVWIARPEDTPSWITQRLILHGASRPIHPRHELPASPIPSAEPIIECRDVRVSYAGSPILSGITWTVRRGERWAVLGPNGSGKTTLLSLLCGDHPQAYANDIRLFGRKRGSGESIWEVKRRIGLLSPELHLCFTTTMTVQEVIASGFFDVFARRTTSSEQDRRIGDLLAAFGLEPEAGTLFRRLSIGRQRLVLFLRAIVKTPDLLILDEPFQGLDAAMTAMARAWLDDHLLPRQTLLFVTHRRDEIPQTVDREIHLQDGRVARAQTPSIANPASPSSP